MSNVVSWIIKAQDQFSSTAKNINISIVNITKNIKKAGEASDTFSHKLNRALTLIEKKTVNARLSSKELAHSLSLITAPMVAIGVGALHAASKYQQLQAAFTSMRGSVKGATQELSVIQKFSRISPFSFFDVAKSEKLLRQSHVGPKSIMHLMHNLGDISAGAGLPLERLSTIISKVTGKGWITNAEIGQLRAYHIDILDDLAKKSGRTRAQVFADVKKRRVGVLPVLSDLDKYTQKNGIFYKQMEKQLDTLGGAFNKMKEGLEVSGFAFGLWLDKAFGIAHKMRKVGMFLQDSVMPFFWTIHKNHPVLEKLLKWFLAFVIVLTVLTPVILVLAKVYEAWALVIKLVSLAQGAFNLILGANPFVLLATLIASAAVGLYYFLNYTKQGKQILNAFSIEGVKGFKAVGEAIKDAWNYTKKLFDKIESIKIGNIWKGIKSTTHDLSMNIPFMSHGKTDVNINLKGNTEAVKQVSAKSKNGKVTVNNLGKNMVHA